MVPRGVGGGTQTEVLSADVIGAEIPDFGDASYGFQFSHQAFDGLIQSVAAIAERLGKG